MLLISTMAAMAAVLFFVGVIQGGDLEPPNGPTMGTTQIPPTWRQSLAADDGADACSSSRFRCVLPTTDSPTGDAVLDNANGLVWQRTINILSSWNGLDLCFSEVSGGVSGWRPPKIEELHSLIDPAALADPMLPAGHPFVGINKDTQIWSATVVRGNDQAAYFEGFPTSPGMGNRGLGDLNLNILCVRGGNGFNAGHDVGP